MYKERAQCGVWTNNEAPKPSKLKRHMETKQPADFFKRKENGLQMQKRLVIRLTRNSESDLKASHLVARRVAQETLSVLHAAADVRVRRSRVDCVKKI